MINVNDMRKILMFIVLIGFMPVTMLAQDDDLYFTPKKKEAKSVAARQQSAYYIGSDRDVDEYNRHGKYWSHYQKLGVDENGSDIIQFQKGDGVYPDSMYVDTTFVGKYRDVVMDDDYSYSIRMSRWDDFYDPWLYGYRWGYGPYWRSAWYDPWYYGGWYDPWYYGYGWGYPYHWSYYYGGWGYPHYHGYWGWPGYWGGVHVVHYGAANGYAGRRSWGGPSRGVTDNSAGRGNRYSGVRNNAGSGNRSFGNRTDYNNRRPGNNAFGNRNNMPSMNRGTFGGGTFGNGGSRSGGFGGGHGAGGGGSRSGGGSFGGGRR